MVQYLEDELRSNIINFLDLNASSHADEISWIENDDHYAKIIEVFNRTGFNPNNEKKGAAWLYIWLDIHDFASLDVNAVPQHVLDKFSSQLTNYGLQDRLQLTPLTWIKIFKKEYDINGNIPRSIFDGFIDAWQFITDYATQLSAYVEDLIDQMPQGADEWYVVGSVFAPILLDIGLDFIPVVGEIKAFSQAFTAMDDGNYTTAGLEFLGGLLGIVPIGDVIKAPVKIFNGVKKTFAAYKVVKALAKFSSNTFARIKILIQQGWEGIWDHGLKKLVYKDPTGNVAGEINQHGVPVIIKKAFIEIIDPSNFKSLTGRTLANPNASNYVPGAFINDHAAKINVVEPTLKTKFDDIVQHGDQVIPPGWGKKTENLIKEILEDSGDYVHYDGSYNSAVDGVNGFDGVFIKGDLSNPTEVIINESKQFTGSGITLNGPGNPPNGISSQLTNDWIRDVCVKLREQGKVDLGDAIENALDDGILTKILTSVDRTGGQLTGGINFTKIN